MQEPAVAQIRSLSSPSNVAAPVVSRLSPTQANAMELQRLGAETRMGFAKAIAGVAKHVADRKPAENLADAGNVKAAAQTAGLVHSWADQAPAGRLRLEVLLQKPEPLTIEADAQVVEGDWS